MKKQIEAAAPAVEEASCVPAPLPESSEYEEQIKGLQESKRLLYERYQMGEIDLATYMREKTAYSELILKTKSAYAALSAQVRQDQKAREKQAQRKSITRERAAATDLTAALADLLIDKVRVYPESRIEIAYKVQDLFE